MSDSHEASSIFFAESISNDSPLEASNHQSSTSSSSSSSADSHAYSDDERQNMAAETWGYHSLCAKNCHRRRPVIDEYFIQYGQVHPACGYPIVPTDPVIIQCTCLCQCDEAMPPSSNAEPLSVFDERIGRYDIVDDRYNPADHSNVSDSDSTPHERVSICELDEMNIKLTAINEDLILDLIASGRYSREHVIKAFGDQAYDLIYPEYFLETEMAIPRLSLRVPHHPPEHSYRYRAPTPFRCRYCRFVIADYRDICEIRTRPLLSGDETSSISVGTGLVYGRNCRCHCTCDSESYHSSNTSWRAPGQPLRSPSDRNRDSPVQFDETPPPPPRPSSSDN